MKKLVFLVAIGLSQPVFADISCSGVVNTVLQYANGSVNVHTSYRNEYTVMCNVETHWKGVSPEACKSMVSVLLTAQSTGRKIATYYSGDSYTCQTLPHYGSAPGPIYVGIVGGD